MAPEGETLMGMMRSGAQAPSPSPEKRSLPKPPRGTPGADQHIQIVDFADLARLAAGDDSALVPLRAAFVGDQAFGVVAIKNVPGYAAARREAFAAAVDLAVHDAEGRERCAAVRQTYPGWSGEPGREAHPLQSNFLHNIKEDVGRHKKVDTFYGTNTWPNPRLRQTFKDLDGKMFETSLLVMKGLDRIVKDETGRMTMEAIADEGTCLAGRWIWYDSAYSREDTIFDDSDAATQSCAAAAPDAANAEPEALGSMRTHATKIRTTGLSAPAPEDQAGSMRTHATKIRTTGLTAAPQEEEALGSMRTHATKIRTTGLSAPAPEDQAGSMRTHATKIRTTGLTAPVQEDQAGSMRTHATKIRTTGLSAPAPEDQAGSMRTHATKIRTTGLTAPVQEDQAGSMRTHATKIRTTGGAAPSSSAAEEAGEYWLPWHIDSQFITLLSCDDYFDEKTGEQSASRPRGAGLLAMNTAGDVTHVGQDVTDEMMLVQMGGFGQIWTGGLLRACRHAVARGAAVRGVARTTYCNFMYAPWDLICEVPSGRNDLACNTGWNAMMDASYAGISMRESFQRFRDVFARTLVSAEMRAESFRKLSNALPPPAEEHVTVDVLTDVRCPFSHVGLVILDEAVAALPQGSTVSVRYHAAYLDPDVEPESLDTYLLREFGAAHDPTDDSSFYGAGRRVGVAFNPKRRVVNTKAFFQALSLVPDQRVYLTEVSRLYFEEAVDISQTALLCETAARLFPDAEPLTPEAIANAASSVSAAYDAVAPLVRAIPHVVLRRPSGAGAELVGAKGRAECSAALRRCFSAAPAPAAAGAAPPGLLPAPGVLVKGLDGASVRLWGADETSPVSLHAAARRGFKHGKWPYTAADLERIDDDDEALGEAPNLEYHLDEVARATLSRFYGSLLRTAKSVLDICSSHDSHYPADRAWTRVALHGLNAAELRRNAAATEAFVVRDLNKDPRLDYADGAFDAVTNVSSVAYLTRPLEVFRETHRVLRSGGVATFAFSNRCHDSKAVAVWLRSAAVGVGLVDVVSSGLDASAPWASVETLDLSKPGSDPLWVVIATKA